MVNQPDSSAVGSPKHAAAVPECERSPLLQLEILRGQTQFPTRPVYESRFLIGGDPGCQLRLGGDGVPALHSILHYDGENFWLDAVAETPALVVNGSPLRSASLQDGDTVSIGAIEFIVHDLRRATSATMPATIPIELDHVQAIASDDAMTDPAELSAAELVASIEMDQRMIDEFESGRRAGGRALLHAARNHVDAPRIAGKISGPHAQPGGPTQSPAVSAPLHLVSQMQALITQLDALAEELSRHDLTGEAADNSLVDAHAKLAEQIDHLGSKLGSGNSGPAKIFRASA